MLTIAKDLCVGWLFIQLFCPLSPFIFPSLLSKERGHLPPNAIFPLRTVHIRGKIINQTCVRTKTLTFLLDEAEKEEIIIIIIKEKYQVVI